MIFFLSVSVHVPILNFAWKMLKWDFLSPSRKKNGFVTATKLGTKHIFFVAATKNFAAASKRFVDRTKHFVVLTKYLCYPFFNK